MNTLDVLVITVGVLLTGFLAWFFFGPKKARQAELVGRVQEVQVTVKGGYSPDLIRVRQSVPLRILFDRQESGECTSRVVFPDFAVSQTLPAHSKTAVEFIPDRDGRFGFACGMNMVHGTLIVDPADDTPAVSPRPAPPAASPEPSSPTAGPGLVDAEAADRKSEIADLTRRVMVAGILTAPVLFAVMAGGFLPSSGVRDVLLNRWVQLALISPVMIYAGWPIHSLGWLTL